MGDRGGKKNKEKNQQQQVKKRKDKERQKTDHTQPRTPVAGARPEETSLAR
jgi:hypothetical protein